MNASRPPAEAPTPTTGKALVPSLSSSAACVDSAAGSCRSDSPLRIAASSLARKRRDPFCAFDRKNEGPCSRIHRHSEHPVPCGIRLCLSYGTACRGASKHRRQTKLSLSLIARKRDAEPLA